MIDSEKEVLSLLSLLLQYPDNTGFKSSELRLVVSELKDAAVRQNIVQFLDYVDSAKWEQLAENYVATFDFSEHSNLYLTSLLYPEDRKRGQILADLKEVYNQAGLETDAEELPDYLPMLLEFLSVASEDEWHQVLEIAGPGIEKLWKQLVEIHSPYAGLLEACVLSARLAACSQTAHAGGGVS